MCLRLDPMLSHCPLSNTPSAPTTHTCGRDLWYKHWIRFKRSESCFRTKFCQPPHNRQTSFCQANIKPGFLHCSSYRTRLQRRRSVGSTGETGYWARMNSSASLLRANTPTRAQLLVGHTGRDLTNASHVRTPFPSEHDDSMYATRT